MLPTGFQIHYQTSQILGEALGATSSVYGKHGVMDACDTGGEWRKAYEGGKLFRAWHSHAGLSWRAWHDQEGWREEWVNERLVWARQEGNKGIAMPEVDGDGFSSDWEEKLALELFGPDPDP